MGSDFTLKELIQIPRKYRIQKIPRALHEDQGDYATESNPIICK